MSLGVPEGLLWTPQSGMTSSRERQAAAAVREYEADLQLGQRQDTKEWVVFLRHSPHSDGQPFPIFSFGKELPTADKVKEMLYKADVRRHGDKIFRQINESNERKRTKAMEDHNEMLAEALVEGFRNQGFDPFPKSLPNKHPKNRQYRTKES